MRGRRPNWAHRVARRRVQSQPRAARRIRRGWRAYASRARALVDVAGPTYGGGSGGHGYAAEVSLEGSLRVRIAALLRVQLRSCGADPACRCSRSIAGHLTARLRNPGLSIAGPPACRGPARLASPSRSPAGQQS